MHVRWATESMHVAVREAVADGRAFVHHGDMEWLAVLVALAVVAAGLLWWRDRRGGQRQPSATPTDTPPGAPEPRPSAVEGPWLGTIRLDVEVQDPESEAVQRLVQSATDRVFRRSPDVDEVVVEDRVGRHVATVPRHVATPGPPPTRPDAAAPPPRPHGSWREPEVRPSTDEDARVGRRPLAERLELPPSVQARIDDSDDAVDIVRAILEAADQPVEVVGRMVRSGDDVVIVVDDKGMSSAAMSQAFLRFRDSGARRGVVIHLGYVDPREIKRRRAMTPELGHAGPEVLQQMADAVELGGDPVQFALADAGT